MSELIAYIESLNAQTQAWVDENPTERWAGMIVTEESHWNDMGIFTVEDFKRDRLICEIRECSKSAYGSRVNLDWDQYSIEELEEMSDSYGSAADAQFQFEQEQEAKNVAKFEGFIQEMISWGAADRETAIRWLLEAENFSEFDLMYGGSYACYTLNLPYSYEKEFNTIMSTMKPAKEAA
jgi:hypothetical protein